MLKNKKVLLAFIGFLIIFVNISAFADTNKDIMEVKNSATKWCTAIGNAKGDYKKILVFYSPDAILLPTLSPDILHNSPEEMGAYFKHLTGLQNIKCEINKITTNDYDNILINTGLYTFSYLDEQKHLVVLPARFTFVYLKSGKEWLIINHHSSLLPEKKQ